MNEWINKSRTGGSAGEKEAGVQQRPKEKKKREAYGRQLEQRCGTRQMIIWVGNTPRKLKSEKALRESKTRVKIYRNTFVNYFLHKPDRSAPRHCITLLPQKNSFLLRSTLSLTAVSHCSFLHLLQLLHNLHWLVLQEVTSFPCSYYILFWEECSFRDE